MKKIIVLVFLTISTWAIAADISLEYGRSIYSWKEYGIDNKQLLEENGAINNFSSTFYLKELSPYLYRYEVNASVFEGGVDYDGQDQNEREFNSKSNIEGFKLSASYLGPIYKKGRLNINYRAGIGYEKWNRSIESGQSYLTGIPSSARDVIGYDERFEQIFLQAGIVTNYKTFIIEVGTRYPIYFKEEVLMSEIGYLNDLELTPGSEFSPYLHSKFYIKDNLSINFNIDSKLIEKSDRDRAKYYGEFGRVEEVVFLQPKSLQLIYSLSLEYFI